MEGEDLYILCRNEKKQDKETGWINRYKLFPEKAKA